MIVSSSYLLDEDRMFITNFLSENCEFENKFAKHKTLNLSESIVTFLAWETAKTIAIECIKREKRKRDEKMKDVDDSNGDVDGFDTYSIADMQILLKANLNRIPNGKFKQDVINNIQITDRLIMALTSMKDFFVKAFAKGFTIIQRLYRYIMCEIIMRQFTALCNIFSKKNKEVKRSKTGDLIATKFLTAYEGNIFKQMGNDLGKVKLVESGIVAGAAAVGIGFAVYKGLAVAVEIVRLAVYYFFYLKEKLSTYLEINAEYLRLNSRNVNNSKVSEEQSKWADKLEKYANKISADQQNADYNAKKDIEKDKVKIEKGEVKKPSNNDSDNDDAGLEF